MAGGVSGVGASNAQYKTSNTSEAEKTKVVSDVINSAVAGMNESKGSLSFLGEGRIDKVKGKIQDDMNKFIQANPNATPAEIEAEAKKSASKNESVATFDKMRDDNFFKKLMSRRKELIGDMWG
ncbi:hypothetical protein D7Y13_18305 [Corallococcus praedator]|uniref:DUF4168 domain-containing protein n=1 Tax=Corallococcus praedator TaxID=2316724 RepID=A0ABX9QGZ4_9BACT|nr:MULTISPECIES: hypothetical protein [Corallococcus]RKH10753.1 hypothetical protein D7X74_26890 [Corallococcus sp. CA047B]RKH25816.1 hypothetical protein D7X75_29360 [Corallococcus sp. CA031C]RKI07300.1 hypothetical protein D7Y13_18305 [Corallococcus praedator]